MVKGSGPPPPPVPVLRTACPHCGRTVRFTLPGGQVIDETVKYHAAGMVAAEQCRACLGAWTVYEEADEPAMGAAGTSIAESLNTRRVTPTPAAPR